MDDDGYLFILGRKKDLIIRKGQNIWPSDIEVVLATHPKVAEIAAVGIPDEVRGENVRAYISLKPGERATAEEIRHFGRPNISDYKLPKEIIFLGSLPKTITGQIDKEALKSSLPFSYQKV